LPRLVNASLFSSAGIEAPPFPICIAPVIMIVGYFIMKKLVFDLVDEVWDDGGSLLIRNRGHE
jgi:hypothetical protein